MAQSASELKENKISRGRNKSTYNQIEMSKLDLLDLDPIEVLDWEVEKLEAGLKELGITIGFRKIFDFLILLGNQEKSVAKDSCLEFYCGHFELSWRSVA